MGPQLPLRRAVDVNGWAQYCPETLLSMILNGLTPAAEYIVDVIKWAQRFLERFCQSYWMGPQLPLRDVVDIIEWVLHCLEEVLSIVLDAPSDATEMCRRCYWMGPHLPQMTLSILLNGPSIVL
jgi:hypothetical protein